MVAKLVRWYQLDRWENCEYLAIIREYSGMTPLVFGPCGVTWQLDRLRICEYLVFMSNFYNHGVNSEFSRDTNEQ